MNSGEKRKAQKNARKRGRQKWKTGDYARGKARFLERKARSLMITEPNRFLNLDGGGEKGAVDEGG